MICHSAVLDFRIVHEPFWLNIVCFKSRGYYHIIMHDIMSLLPHKWTPRVRTYLYTNVLLKHDRISTQRYTGSTGTTILQVYTESTIALQHSYALSVLPHN